MEQDKPKAHRVTVEITPDHWDHLTSEDVERWVLYALLRAKNSTRYGAVEAGGREAARVARIRLPDSEVGKHVNAMEDYVRDAQVRTNQGILSDLAKALRESY